MRIVGCLSAPGQGSYYCEDIAALHRCSVPDADRWTAKAMTPGFRTVREIAQTLSVGLVLDDGFTAWGDAVGVSYGGKAGRDPILQSAAAAEALRTFPLEGPLGNFRDWQVKLENSGLPVALRYGISQALLGAVAHATRQTPAAVLNREWNLPADFSPVALQGSSGNDRHANADKMIFNRLEALPHTQVDDIALQFGNSGEVLLEYARWLVGRVRSQGEDYRPTLHFDVHGAAGKVFGLNPGCLAAYLIKLAQACDGLPCRIESPVVADYQGAQIEILATLREYLYKAGVPMGIVADEWANTRADIALFVRHKAVDMIHIKMPDLGGLDQSLESVLLCRAAGVQSLLGGSCIETDLSARLGVHVALAGRPDVYLVKPGMGINEGISIVRNEMARARVQGESQWNGMNSA